uniref:Uncharacterized protein n=1 Tax=Arundo donax TaxID=35708 RepID=A0A0A8Y1B9_ARUDO
MSVCLKLPSLVGDPAAKVWIKDHNDQLFTFP